MTEAEWLAVADPTKAFNHLRVVGSHSQRKLRYFAVACCRRLTYWLTESELGAALDVAERFADGLATEIDLTEADRAVVTIEDQLEKVVLGKE